MAIERKTRYVYAELCERTDIKTTVQFLENTIADAPFKIHIILTDNGIQFSYRMLTKRPVTSGKTHEFDVVCEKFAIQHRLIEFRHPWTNGLVERMNRSIKDATVKIYFYETLNDLKRHLALWLLAYNHQKKLKSLHYTSPYDAMCAEFAKEPARFLRSPLLEFMGPNR